MRMGGVVIAAGFFLTFALLLVFNPALILGSWLGNTEGVSLIGSLMLVLGLGIWDDIESLRPSQKFIVQVLFATIIYFAGFRISTISIPFFQENISIGYFDYPLTILWIVGITNAINLIDGLDGLASGVATIAFLSVFPIALYNGDIATAMLSLIVAGSLIGFLRYNFNPARIFFRRLGQSLRGLCFVGADNPQLDKRVGDLCCHRADPRSRIADHGHAVVHDTPASPILLARRGEA
jgi:UDP-GlcNAc:undecaprenyl-phosphate GlcNAc-1-phosphate transferase